MGTDSRTQTTDKKLTTDNQIRKSPRNHFAISRAFVSILYTLPSIPPQMG